MSNEMRRTLAHLGTPRTMGELASRLQIDQYVGVSDVEALVEDALEQGYVVHLGRHDDAKSVVEAVGNDDDAIDFGKGQAKTWANRAENGRYDLSGDLYILSKEGLEAIQGDDRDPEEAESE